MPDTRGKGARSVDAVPGFADVVESQIRALDADCATGALFLIDELEAADPDLDERCGLLDLRHEVYAVRIPGCRRHRLAISIDRGGNDACAVHGVVPAAARACDAAHGLAAAQLKLTGRPWEPAYDRTFAQGPPPRGATRRRRGA